MPKQNEYFAELEKVFFRKQLLRPEVRRALLAGGNNLVNALNLIWPEYKAAFSSPMEAEPLLEYQARLSNACPDRKPQIWRKSAEDEVAAQKRMDERRMVRS